ncbi:MAG: response regulator [Proteobacteria bacterium]|nr:response regulator [Burkholderiales bacterium]
MVDDEAPVRTALGRLLRSAHYDVASFASGEEFLAAFEQEPPHCVILDIHMPGLSGLDVQLQLRARHNPVPIVFISASDDISVGVAVVQGGGQLLLRKPFSSSDLLEAVDAAVHSTP